MTEFSRQDQFAQLEQKASLVFTDYHEDAPRLLMRAFFRQISGFYLPPSERVVTIGDVMYQPYYGTALEFANPNNREMLAAADAQESEQLSHAGIQFSQTVAPLSKVTFDESGKAIVAAGTPVATQKAEIYLGFVDHADDGNVYVYNNDGLLVPTNGHLYTDYNAQDVVHANRLEGNAAMHALLVQRWAAATVLYAEQAKPLGLEIDPAENVWHQIPVEP